MTTPSETIKRARKYKPPEKPALRAAPTLVKNEIKTGSIYSSIMKKHDRVSTRHIGG